MTSGVSLPGAGSLIPAGTRSERDPVVVVQDTSHALAGALGSQSLSNRKHNVLCLCERTEQNGEVSEPYSQRGGRLSRERRTNPSTRVSRMPAILLVSCPPSLKAASKTEISVAVVSSPVKAAQSATREAARSQRPLRVRHVTHTACVLTVDDHASSDNVGSTVDRSSLRAGIGYQPLCMSRRHTNPPPQLCKLTTNGTWRSELSSSWS